MPFDEFDQDEGAVRPVETRARRITFLEGLMKTIGAGNSPLPPRYELFPGAILHDLLSVWRQKNLRDAPSLKSLFEVAYGSHDAVIPPKTFKNWFDGTSRIDRPKARAILVAMLDNWPDGQKKRFRFCTSKGVACREGAKSYAASDVCDGCSRGIERLLEVVFTFHAQRQDEIFVLPSPGYSTSCLLEHCARNDLSIVFPLDTATAHIWDEDSFFDGFEKLEEFLRLRRKGGARFIYVLKPYDLRYGDEESRRQVTGEALYRAAMERIARNTRDLGREEISDAIKMLVRADNFSDVPTSSGSHGFLERALMPSNLRASFAVQSQAFQGTLQLESYFKKQLHTKTLQEFQYFASGRADDSDNINFYLSCVPEREKKGKSINRQNPQFPLQSFVKGLDSHFRRIIAAAAITELDAIPGWHMIGLDSFLSLPLDRTFGRG
jgi:hypothetical protein